MTRYFRYLAWLLVGAVAVFTLSPIEARPVTPAPADIERLLAFGLIGVTFGLGYPKHRFGVLLAVIALAGVLEVAQHFVVGRHGRVHDGIIKASGALFGASIVMIRANWNHRA
jgi:VanZ family protein